MGQQGAHVCDVQFRRRRRSRRQSARRGRRGASKSRCACSIAAGCTSPRCCVGIAERLIGDAVGYAGERRQFGKPIGEHQLVQAMIADSKTETMAARALVLEAAALKDAGQPITLEAAAAKYFASETVGRVADRTVQIYGGAGYIADYGIERLYRDVRLFRIYEGTSQVQQLVIARETIKRGG
jgi:acyl-CoA dehydrogenase